jgi:hypothetical protein
VVEMAQGKFTARMDRVFSESQVRSWPWLAS